MKIDQKDIRCTENLYWNQITQIRIEGKMSDAMKIQKELRQGCILSSLLFNFYSEKIFKEVLEEVKKGIKE